MQSIDLMPQELRRRRFLIDRAKTWGVVIGVWALVMFGGHRSLAWRLGVLQAAVARDDDIAAQLARVKQETSDLGVWQERFRAQKSLMRRFTKHSGWEEMLREVAGVVGDAIWLRDLSIESEQHPLPHGRGSDGSRLGSLRLSGFALSHAEFAGFLSRLEGCGTLEGVKPMEARVGKLLEGMLIEFSVVGTVVGPPLRREIGTRAGVVGRNEDVELALGRIEVMERKRE